MTTYNYEGQKYNIETDDPNEAKQKILAHLGKSAKEDRKFAGNNEDIQYSPEGIPLNQPLTTTGTGPASPIVSGIGGAVSRIAQPIAGAAQMMSGGRVGREFARDLDYHTDQLQADNPKSYGTGAVAGEVAKALLPVKGMGAFTGGAVYGAGSGALTPNLSDNTGLDYYKDQAKNAAIGGAFGAATGGLIKGGMEIPGIYRGFQGARGAGPIGSPSSALKPINRDVIQHAIDQEQITPSQASRMFDESKAYGGQSVPTGEVDQFTGKPIMQQNQGLAVEEGKGYQAAFERAKQQFNTPEKIVNKLTGGTYGIAKEAGKGMMNAFKEKGVRAVPGTNGEQLYTPQGGVGVKQITPKELAERTAMFGETVDAKAQAQDMAAKAAGLDKSAATEVAPVSTPVKPPKDVMNMMSSADYQHARNTVPTEAAVADPNETLMRALKTGTTLPRSYINAKGSVVDNVMSGTNQLGQEVGTPINTQRTSYLPNKRKVIESESPTHTIRTEYDPKGQIQNTTIIGRDKEGYPLDILSPGMLERGNALDEATMRKMRVNTPEELNELSDLAHAEAYDKLIGMQGPVKPRDVMNMITPEEYKATMKESDYRGQGLDVFNRLANRPDPPLINEKGSYTDNWAHTTPGLSKNDEYVERAVSPQDLSRVVRKYPGHDLTTEEIRSPTHTISTRMEKGKLKDVHLTANEENPNFPGKFAGVRNVLNKKSFKDMNPHNVEDMKRLGVETYKQLKELIDLARIEAEDKLVGVKPEKTKKTKK